MKTKKMVSFGGWIEKLKTGFHALQPSAIIEMGRHVCMYNTEQKHARLWNFVPLSI